MLLVPLASVPGCGDLLRHIGGGNQFFGVGNIVVLDKKHLHQVIHLRVTVDEPGHLTNIFDDPLGPVIAGGRLGAKEIGSGLETGDPPLFQAPVGVQDGESVEKLPFVLMKALDLHVKEEIFPQLKALPLCYIIPQLPFLFLLHLLEPGHHRSIPPAREPAAPADQDQ